MKKSTLVITGMLALTLTFGLILAGCSTGDGESTDKKELVISNIPKNILDAGFNDATNKIIEVGIYPSGTTKSQAGQTTGVIAGGSFEPSKVNNISIGDRDSKYFDASYSYPGAGEPYRFDVYLYTQNPLRAWTGTTTGADVYFIVAKKDYYHLKNGKTVTITEKQASVNFVDDFELVQ